VAKINFRKPQESIGKILKYQVEKRRISGETSQQEIIDLSRFVLKIVMVCCGAV